jgi:hypothetical protein
VFTVVDEIKQGELRFLGLALVPKDVSSKLLRNISELIPDYWVSSHMVVLINVTLGNIAKLFNLDTFLCITDFARLLDMRSAKSDLVKTI